MLKAVIFDIDGVLLDSQQANIKFFQDLLEKVGYKRPSKKEASKVFHLTMWDALKALTKERSKPKLKVVWEMGHHVRYPVELLKMPKHAKSVVKKLGKDYKLAIVTSRIEKGVEDFFQISNLRRQFRVVVSFEDYANPKPHPEPLLVALRRLKMKPEEAVYIGDTESDIQSAKAAGVKMIMYSKSAHKGADINVASFKEIPGAIAKISKKR